MTCNMSIEQNMLGELKIPTPIYVKCNDVLIKGLHCAVKNCGVFLSDLEIQLG